MSDTAPGGEAPGGGVEERESEGGAVTSGSDLVQPSAAAPTADAGASEAAPASTGGEGVAGGEGVEGSVDIDTARGALIAAPARADDDGASGTRQGRSRSDSACVSGAPPPCGAPNAVGWAGHLGTAST